MGTSPPQGRPPRKRVANGPGYSKNDTLGRTDGRPIPGLNPAGPDIDCWNVVAQGLIVTPLPLSEGQENRETLRDGVVPLGVN
jgi:hypothetical protein